MHLQHLCRSCRKLVVCVVFSPLFSCFHGAVLDALLADTLRNWGSFVVNAVMACQAIANIVKSSLGPVGLDKMLVDDIGDVTITNDGATILKMLEVEHPAAKVLVELAELQDREVGDGTTSVVIIAAELLKRANELVRNKIHPTSIISGYRLAMREACKYINDKLAIKVRWLKKIHFLSTSFGFGGKT
jgi:chaperonin GroEL (HSP60 family)